MPRTAAIRLRFSDYVLPSSVLRQSLWVTPTLLSPTDGKPVGPVAFTKPVYDPYDDVVVFNLPAGRKWLPGTRYFVKLLSPQEDGGSVIGFRGLDSAPLKEEDDFSFVTEVKDDGISEGPVLPKVRFCPDDEGDSTLPAVHDVFTRSCAIAGCHVAGSSTSPAMGLDLSSVVGLGATAVDIVAVQTEHGALVGSAAINAQRFGDRMPRISPRNPAGSYLVYKLLINPGNYATPSTQGPPDPWVGELGYAPVPSAARIEKLRNRFVGGQPMPLGSSLKPSQMRTIVRWILQGATSRTCD